MEKKRAGLVGIVLLVLLGIVMAVGIARADGSKAMEECREFMPSDPACLKGDWLLTLRGWRVDNQGRSQIVVERFFIEIPTVATDTGYGSYLNLGKVFSLDGEQIGSISYSIPMQTLVGGVCIDIGWSFNIHNNGYVIGHAYVVRGNLKGVFSSGVYNTDCENSETVPDYTISVCAGQADFSRIKKKAKKL